MPNISNLTAVRTILVWFLHNNKNAQSERVGANKLEHITAADIVPEKELAYIINSFIFVRSPSVEGRVPSKKLPSIQSLDSAVSMYIVSGTGPVSELDRSQRSVRDTRFCVVEGSGPVR